LNTKLENNLCSVGNAATLYDHWNDINGDPMPWISQGVYDEGDEITVEAVLTTNHAGHMDMYLCPDGNDSTQECLWANPATLVRDELYGGPTDPTYPERAYFANDKSEFKFTYKLPEGLYGDNVLIQWRYITANSCFPPGYKGTAVGDRLLELGWLRASGMGDCLYPYDPTGATGAGKPEQFWNCAEITINARGPTPPTPPTPPTTAAPVGPSPTKAPVGPSPGYCSYAGIWDTNREECDGLAEGGDWCNENQGQCEGSCNGNWCIIVTPTLSPTYQPTPKASPRPTASSTNQPTTCTDVPSDEFFYKMKDGAPKFKTCEWLASKPDDKITKTCEKKTDWYDGIGPAKEVCKETCQTCPTASPTMRPTISPTSSPNKVPTKAPTKAQSSAPTRAPHPTEDVCCSQFFDVCKDNPWCQESEENCVTCNGVFLPNLPLTCTPRFGMCSSDEECCYPSTCVVGLNGGTAGQCMYYP